MNRKQVVRQAIQTNLPRAGEFLKRIIDVQSFSCGEENVVPVIEEAFQELGCRVERAFIPEGLINHPLYCNVKGKTDYSKTCNLIVTCEGKRPGGLVMNTHMDTVPAPSEMLRATEKDGVIYGRGACDAKGQIATIYLIMAALKSSGIVPEKDVTAHIVVEEEVGGNGSLGLWLRNETFEKAIVLEPTDLQIATGARGAIWFHLDVLGKAGHSGDAKNTVNGIRTAVDAISVMDAYHKELLERLRDTPPFEGYANPMPLNIGRIAGGDWPATVPSYVMLEGVLGFLPGTDAATVTTDLAQKMKERFEEQVRVSAPFQRDVSVLPREHPLVKKLAESAKTAGLSGTLTAFPACCDAWFYTQKGIPTVIFGPGALSDAHTEHEKILVSALVSAAQTICGVIMEDINESDCIA